MGLNVTTSEALNKVLDYIEYALQTKNVREESVNQISTFLLDTVEKFQSSSIKIEEVTLKNITLVIASSAEISSNTNSQNGQSIFHPFMRALEKFSSITIIPEGKSSVTIKTPKIILNIVDVIGTNNFRKSIFYNNTILADIHIPKSVFLNANQSTRVTVVVYSGLTTPTHYGELNKIISVKVGERKITGLKEKIKLSFATEQKLGQKNIPDTLLSIKTLAECIFYDDESKQWSTRGCFLESGSNPITCHVDHLTNFAIIVSSEQVTRDVTLGIVSQIGCILSITSLIFTIVLYLYSKKWKKNRPSLELLHICMNLIIAYIIFLTGVTPTGNRATCITVTALLQYFYLTAWGWIGIYTRDMYLSLVQVYSSQSRKYMAKVTGLAYTLPIIIVITHALVAIAYTDNQSSNLISTTEGVLYKTSAYYSESACWLHGDSLYFGFLLPVGIILVHNIGSVILVTYEIGWKSSTIQSSAGKRSTMSKIRIAVVLGILVGGTWILGFLLLISEDILYSLIMGWLFTIFNSSQGFFLFVLLCVRPKDMRQIWWSPIRRTLLTCTLIQRLSRNFNHQSSGEHSMQSERLPIQELPGEGSVMTTTSLPSATASHSSSPSPKHFRKGSPQTTTSKATQITTVSPCHSSQVKMQIRNQIISHPCVIKITSPDGDEATSKTL